MSDWFGNPEADKGDISVGIFTEKEAVFVPVVTDMSLYRLAEVMEPGGEAPLVSPSTKTVADILKPFRQELGGDREGIAQLPDSARVSLQNMIHRSKDDANSCSVLEVSQAKVLR